MKNNKKVIPIVLEEKIFLIRGRKVMIDAHLAELYQVSTMRMNEQVKRNRARFPEDFMFQLTREEKEEVIAICDNLRKLKFSRHPPYVFTEHGVVMLSAILRSARAIEMSTFIVRAFIKLRELLLTNMDLSLKIDALEKIQKEQGEKIISINSAVARLINPPKNKIGFNSKDIRI